MPQNYRTPYERRRLADMLRGAPSPQQEQQGQGVNPMQAYNMYSKFAGGGAGGAAASGAGGVEGGIAGLAPGGAVTTGSGAGSLSGAAGSGAGGGGGGAGALMSNPAGWIAAAALFQNAMHNKGVASWEDAFKGQAPKKIISHYFGEPSGAGAEILGPLGFSDAGKWYTNPSLFTKKLFGLGD